MPSESKPMSVKEIRERVLQAADGGKGIAQLIADLDDATPAMEKQERDAEKWQSMQRPDDPYVEEQYKD